MRNKFRESNLIVQRINKKNYSFSQHKNADISFFQQKYKDIIQQTFKVQ